MPGRTSKRDDGRKPPGLPPARRAFFFFALFAVVLAARLCHSGILWAEETYPMAGALQMLEGKALYRDAWFDKPALAPALYALVGPRPGWRLRLAGALYVLAACWLAWRFGRALWGEREGFFAAALLAFFLTFWIPSAVVPLASDLLMLAPHLGAVYLAWSGRPLASGAAAAAALLLNPKGVFVLAAAGLWGWRRAGRLALGFALPCAAALLWLWSQGALAAHYEQVWEWGRLYARHTFVERPVLNGLLRTLNWLGFHAALVLGATWFFAKEPGGRLRWAAWFGLSFLAVAAGWRFFPRYFFQMLPPLVLSGARGLALLLEKRPVPASARTAPAYAGASGNVERQGLAGARSALALAVLLLVPAARFGPRYLLLARDWAAGVEHAWQDTAMDRDSREAARIVRPLARPGDQLFVWGYRPELFVYTGLPAATRFLDSQPLTGVPADRHLTGSAPIEREAARRRRVELAATRPQILIDGLSSYNPSLSASVYPELREWLKQYREVARSKTTVTYRRKE